MSHRALARSSSEDWMAGGCLGDVLVELRKEGHISDQQYALACCLLRDMRKAHGNSNGIVASFMQERVQTSTRNRDRPPGGGDPDAFRRMDAVLHGLRRHERDVLAYLICRRELPRGSLSELGRGRSAYKTQKTMRAAAVGRIGALLDSIAEVYAVAAARP